MRQSLNATGAGAPSAAHGEDNERMAEVRQAADTIRAVLEAIGHGDLQASKTERARLEGAVAALETLAAADETEPPD